MASEGRVVELGAEGASGYLVEPQGEGRAPGLIIVHEWWGLNDHIKDIADRLAGEGYVALAPDLYGGVTTKDPEEAGRLMQGLDQAHALQILDAAVEHLKSNNRVDGGRIGVTGFCMGGTFALLLACHNRDVKASAPFYGDVPPDETLKELSAPVFFIGAENDPWITRDKMGRLEEGLKRFGKEGEVKVYGGVGHAFFNDTRPDAYDRQAAHDAWASVMQFLKSHLGT